MIHVAPGSVHGRLRAPASKSHLQRLVLGASLAEGESLIRDPGSSADGEACLAVIQGLGARVAREGSLLRIRGGGKARSNILNCGESGTCLRMAVALAALGRETFTLVGEGSLATRPMAMVLEPLRQLGARCETRDGHAPITVRGPLLGGRAAVDGRESSQLLSGLLLALPRAGGDSELEVQGLRSRPYVRMTLDVLAAFGVRAESAADSSWFRIPGGQAYRPVDLAVEGDWSGAAFLLVAGAVAGEVTVDGLDPASAQADRAVLEALAAAGAGIHWQGPALCGSRPVELRGLRLRRHRLPGPVPAPGRPGLPCPGHQPDRRRGPARAQGERPGRGPGFRTVGALGAALAVRGGCLEITGGPLEGGGVDPHNDHRMAMACAVAGLKSRYGVRMEGEACVAKSYPDFFQDLESIRG